MKALLVIDVQNDFIDGSLAVPKGKDVVPVINRLIISNKFEYIVATQDSHPAGHKSFAENHQDKKPGDVIDLNGIQQVLWPRHCVAYDTGSYLNKALLAGRFDMIFRKGMNPEVDSYSAFFDNAQKATGLGEFLLAVGVKDVYVTGLATDCCVKFTALGAIKYGFATNLIADGCKAANIKPSDGTSAIKEMETAGVIIHDVGDELIKKL